MLAIRFNNSSTSINLNSLISLVNDPGCKRVILFSSPNSMTSDYSGTDGPDTNLPLVSALAIYSIPGITDVYILFDGSFLTAARRPRYLEVKELLDVAQNSGKTDFSHVAAPFTSSKEALEAIRLLLKHPTVALTIHSREQYFGQLCMFSESQYPV